MSRIYIVGYVNTEDIDPAFLDPTSPTGLTSEGFHHLSALYNLQSMNFSYSP